MIRFFVNLTDKTGETRGVADRIVFDAIDRDDAREQADAIRANVGARFLVSYPFRADYIQQRIARERANRANAG